MKTDVRSVRRVISRGRVPYLSGEKGFEEDANYLPSLLEAKDLWFWDDGLSAGQGKDYPFTLERLVLVPEAARLDVELQGGSDTDVSPDHHVRVFVNGSLVGETSFDGMVPASLALEVLHECLATSQNSHPVADEVQKFAAFIWTSARDRELNLNDVLDTIARTLDYPFITQLSLEDKRHEVAKRLQQQSCLLRRGGR